MARHKIYPVRGDYYELVRAKRDFVRGLVYPMPHPGLMGLGVHFTRTLSGNVLLGPSARYISDKNDYESNRDSAQEFAQGAKRLLPGIEPADLVPAHSGIRAKLTPAPDPKAPDSRSATPADFIIERDPEFPRAIHLMGIESPGLTSAPAIAEHVMKLVSEVLG